MQNWAERDRKVIWHPYTQMKIAPEPIFIKRAEKTLLFDADDQPIIDAVASWWVNIHGHNHPHINQKITQQLNQLEQVIFAGFTHQPAIELSERLCKIYPARVNKAFFSDNGSTAVEVALKMALQYFANKGREKRKIIAFEHAYHGDTFGAMSVSGPSPFNAAFKDLLFEVYFIPIPEKGKEIETINKFKSLISNGDIAAFIFEPLILGSGGMIMYEAEVLDELIKLAKNNDVLCIADEVMTGFGRTGKLFASNWLNYSPDMVCLSKGLTGGYMPMGLTLCSDEIYEAFWSDDKMKMLFHGHSFTANALACAAGLAGLDLCERLSFENDIKRIVIQHLKFKTEMEFHPLIKDIRSKGIILAIEINVDNGGYLNQLRDVLYSFFIKKGILLRPLGNIVYILPPICISNEELTRVYAIIKTALNGLLEKKDLNKI